MDYNEIKILADKYLAGETSLEEEQLLKRYFAQGNLNADFEAIKTLMEYFSSEKEMITSEGFEEKILSKIDEKAKPLKIFKLYWLKVAAAVLLLVGAAGIIYKSVKRNKIVPEQNIAQIIQADNFQTEIKDTYDNPEDAKKEVERALALISRHLNKGKDVAEKNIAKMDVLNKALDN